MRRLAIGLLVTLAGLMLLGTPTTAQSDTDPAPDAGIDIPRVDVLQVSGLIDPILVDSIQGAIERAEEQGSQALILQVNSRGTVVDDDELENLIDDVATTDVPIAIWVGPNGARFYGPAAQLLTVADVTGMAPGARIGYVGQPIGDAGFEGATQDVLRNGSVGLNEARALTVFTEIQDVGVPTITSMVEVLDGREIEGRTLETTKEVTTDSGQLRRDTTSTVRFAKLPLVEQMFHTVASPPVAYLLLLTGLALLVFEFFTAGIGVAAAVGAVCVVLACSGLGVLPTRPWAVALILLSMLAFAVDVQVGIPRFWTGVGIAGTIVASLFLFESLPGTSLRPSWIALLTGVGGITLTFIVGMPNMVRTRFATPTIGREWMIGEEGVAVSDVDPEGVVEVGEGRWRALTNRATPLTAGDPVRVAAIDGVTLEVEPLEGAARDYRERRNKSDDADASDDPTADDQASDENASNGA
ncbi:NfeD family protein [Ilumatobacter nonamiensis]|uniref:NfeD family protein n=1 Tax=Ilumatobacter nonamiensis TaxID=467093 RepID=UPI00034D05F7|nr:NfeD family protein [Ilumatobacter nonamiensis]